MNVPGEVANVPFDRYVRAMPRRTPRRPSSSARRSAPRVVKIQLLTFPDATPIVPVGLYDLLRKAAQLAAQNGFVPELEISLVAVADRRRVLAAGALALECQHTTRTAPKADFVVVSPLDPEVLELRSRSPELRRFLRAAHRRGATLASVCTGAFGLAESGLLDGHRAATHWAFQEAFRARFPAVELMPQEILVDEGRLLSTGGATSFLNFAMYLVERIWGPELARVAARMFLIDERKAPQGAYAIFAGQRQHSDQAILRAQTLIEAQAGKALSVELLASRVAMSRRTFIRRFKAATGAPPREYLQRAAVESAKRQLESTKDQVAEVARHLGYEDLAAFRRLFVRHTGLTPVEYRRRYARVRGGAGAR